MKIGDKFHYLLHIRNFATIQQSSATRGKTNSVKYKR